MNDMLFARVRNAEKPKGYGEKKKKLERKATWKLRQAPIKFTPVA